MDCRASLAMTGVTALAFQSCLPKFAGVPTLSRQFLSFEGDLA